MFDALLLLSPSVSLSLLSRSFKGIPFISARSCSRFFSVQRELANIGYKYLDSNLGGFHILVIKNAAYLNSLLCRLSASLVLQPRDRDEAEREVG